MLGVVYIRGKSLQDRLGDVQTYRTNLVSAYVLHCLSMSYPKLQNMSETCLTLIQHQIPVDIWSYLCPKLCW